MKRTRRIGIATAAVLALALAAGSAASAASFSGVVVHKNTRARSFVLALRGGQLLAVHSARRPAVGRRVNLTARRLRNGTWALQRLRLHGLTRHVRVRGTVTFVNAQRHVFVVSARGVPLLVRMPGGRRQSARAASSGPADGEIVTVSGSVDGNSVDAEDVQSDGQDTNGIDLEGTVLAVDTTLRTLTVSADDSEESGGSLTVDVPTSFDLGLFSAGQAVELIVSPNGDGTYTLEQSSNDTGAQHADNSGEDQGDNHGDNHASAEQACAAEQTDPNFAASHNGQTFGQYYDPQEPTNLNDALGRCIDLKSQQGGGSGGDSGQTGSGSGS